MNEANWHPELGASVKAIGYMVRYASPRCVSEPEHGAWGWKRRRTPFEGIYVGTRRLKVTWWWHINESAYEEEDHKTRAAAYLNVYLVAYSTRACLRYVLPRDVEGIGDDRQAGRAISLPA